MRWFVAILRRVGRALRWLFPRVLLLWLVAVIGLTAAVIVYGRLDRAEDADVIIVLGAGLRRDGRPGPALTRRSEKAAQLYHDGIASHVICTGGRPQGIPRSEADACGEILRAAGVPAEAILLEEDSRSTEENALYAHELMQAQGWQQAVLVSDGFHLLRANWLFQRQGIPNTTSPAATDPPFGQQVVFTGREIAAFHWQALKDFLGLPFTYVPVI